MAPRSPRQQAEQSEGGARPGRRQVLGGLAAGAAGLAGTALWRRGESSAAPAQSKQWSHKRSHTMLNVRPAGERGHANHGWLDSWHTFSFSDYHDPRHMGFRALRVINEDRVAPRNGFGTHPHRDMEIVTYVLSGQLEHRDSMGSHGVIRPGEVQRMSAGTGVLHSEMNPADEQVHFLQIWLLPAQRGLQPSYEQRVFGDERQGRLRLVASPDGEQGSVTVHQDVRLYATLLGRGEQVEHALAPGRHAWLQLARGAGTLNGVALRAGDGVAVSAEERLVLAATEPLEALLFDLA